MSAFLASLLCLMAQDPAPAPGGRPQSAPVERRLPFDGVALTVNQSVLTRRGLGRDMLRWRRDNPDAGEAQMRAAEAELLRSRVNELVRVQAGEDMGLPDEAVQARVRDALDRIQKRQNGWVGMSRFLQSRDMTTSEIKVALRGQMLGELWEDSITGKGPAQGQRVVADRHVRPGRIKLLYERALETEEGLALLGGAPERVKLQQIVLDPSRVGGIEAARKLGDELAAKLAAGADFGALVAEHSAVASNQGIGEYETARLARVEPTLAPFLAGARTDETSAPIPGPRGVVRLVKLLERVERRSPTFASLSTQDTLRKREQERLDGQRLARAYKGRMSGSWIWPSEFREVALGEQRD
jgi:parvulin-like peptidyl-prolyl isomerase